MVVAGSSQGHRGVSAGSSRCQIRSATREMRRIPIENIVLFSTVPFSRKGGGCEERLSFRPLLYGLEHVVTRSVGVAAESRRAWRLHGAPDRRPHRDFRARSRESHVPGRGARVARSGAPDRRITLSIARHRAKQAGAVPPRGAGSPTTSWVSRATARIPRPGRGAPTGRRSPVNLKPTSGTKAGRAPTGRAYQPCNILSGNFNEKVKTFLRNF